jgi:multicomponent Na+:H+ antiporter subunit E
MSSPGPFIPGLATAAIARGLGFLVLWFAFSGAQATDLPASAIAVIAATWASLRLLPPGAWRLSPVALAEFLLRFLRQSILAGADVAWRALHPRLPLRPGFVAYPVRLASGPARNTFCELTSLVPGTLPAGLNEDGALLVHCLDVGQPVLAQLAVEEALLVRVLGMRGNG